MKFLNTSALTVLLAVSAFCSASQAEIVVRPTSANTGSLVLRVNEVDKKAANFDILFRYIKADLADQLSYNSWSNAGFNERVVLPPGRYMLEFSGTYMAVNVQAGQTRVVDMRRIRPVQLPGTESLVLRNMNLARHFPKQVRAGYASESLVGLWIAQEDKQKSRAHFLVLPGTYELKWDLGSKNITTNVTAP